MYVCVSLLSVSLVFVVCVGFVSSFSCLCPPFYVCVFLFSCIGFSVSRVSWLVLCFLLWWVSLLGVLVPVCAVCLRRVSCIVSVCWCSVSVVGGVCMCLMYVPLSLVSAFFVFCSLFVFLSVCVGVLLLVGVSGFIGVCVRPLCICFLCLSYFSLVCLSLSCRFL